MWHYFGTNLTPAKTTATVNNNNDDINNKNYNNKALCTVCQAGTGPLTAREMRTGSW